MGVGLNGQVPSRSDSPECFREMACEGFNGLIARAVARRDRPDRQDLEYLKNLLQFQNGTEGEMKTAANETKGTMKSLPHR